MKTVKIAEFKNFSKERVMLFAEDMFDFFKRNYMLANMNTPILIKKFKDGYRLVVPVSKQDEYIFGKIIQLSEVDKNDSRIEAYFSQLSCLNVHYYSVLATLYILQPNSTKKKFELEGNEVISWYDATCKKHSHLDLGDYKEKVELINITDELFDEQDDEMNRLMSRFLNNNFDMNSMINSFKNDINNILEDKKEKDIDDIFMIK